MGIPPQIQSFLTFQTIIFFLTYSHLSFYINYRKLVAILNAPSGGVRASKHLPSMRTKNFKKVGTENRGSSTSL